MVNHGRTLLLNLAGSTSPGSSYPGEEYIPPSYKPIQLSPALATMQGILLGVNVDRAMMNYRARQLLTLVHSCDLSKYLYELDNKITYWPITDTTLFEETTYGATTNVINGDNSWFIYVTGNPSTQTTVSKVFDSWDIEMTSKTAGTIYHRLAPFDTTNFNLIYSSGVSNTVAIPNTQIGFNLTSGSSTLPTWLLNLTLKPAFSLIDIYTASQQATDVGIDIFGSGEPYSYLESLWNHDLIALPYQLGALVVAYIYQANNILQNGGYY